MSNRIPLTTGNFIAIFITLAVLYICTLYDFLLFHTLAELFSIVIAFGIFLVAWNTRKLQKNRYLLFLGIAYFFVGLVDLAHTTTYKGLMILDLTHASQAEGITVFQAQDSNPPTQLWIIARYTESISLLIAPLFLERKFKPATVFGLYAGITLFLLWSVLADIFPQCYVEGVGLTPFKKISEYIISIILVGAYIMIYLKKDRFSPGIFKLLTVSILLTIGAELAFTFYVSVYGISNIVGHFLKFISFYLVYKALVETGLKEPYALLFRDLSESEKKYRSLFANMLNGFAFHKVIVDVNGKPVDLVFLEVNEAFEKMLGLTKKDIHGKKATQVFQGIEKSSYDFITEFGMVGMTGNTLYTEQYFEITERWYSFSVYSPERGFVAVVFEDITDRKDAEHEKEEHLREVNILMNELERSNQDLQQFANIISHDLTEPLRSVANFTQLLNKRYKGKLDDKADTFIQFIVDGTKRMQKMLTDLLAFARIGGGELQLQPLELRSVLNKALTNLRDSIDRKQAEIDCPQQLPQIMGDETQLVQLFQNLIGNGLKFCNKDKPVICISAAADDNEWIVCVRDNGIGIDPADCQRIFLVFQRLHLQDDFEGTGIGLAQCKKIVERHGGKIWVDSTPGEGSSFYFSIPQG